MINWIPFQEEHLQIFECNEPQLAKRLDMNIPYNHVTLSLMDIKKNRIVAVSGLNYTRPGVGELWQFPGVHAKKYGVQLVKAIKEIVPHLFTQFNLHRIHMTTEVHWKEGPKWAKLLGFELEGTLKDFGPNGDEHIYARVK